MIEPERSRWKSAVRDHIEKKSPRYCTLLDTAADKLDELSPGLSADRLEAELAALLFQHRQKIEAELEQEFASDKPIQSTVRKLMKAVRDVQRERWNRRLMMRWQGTLAAAWSYGDETGIQLIGSDLP